MDIMHLSYSSYKLTTLQIRVEEKHFYNFSFNNRVNYPIIT